MTPERFEDMLRRHGDLLAGRRGPARVVRYACYLIGLTYVAVAFHAHYQAEATYGFDIWSSQHHLLNLWLRTIYELLVFGLVVPMLAFKFIMVQHVIRSVFCDLTRKRVIRLRPLSPDNAGGLGQVGDYALRIVYVLLPPLIPMLLYMFVLRVTPIILIGLGIYIPLLILVFFYPLSGAHRAMKCFKQQELDLLAGEFERVYDCFIGRITQGHDRDPEATARAMEMIGNIDALYDRADAMPVWPFNRQIISRFSAVVAGPVAVLVNEFVINPDSMLWDQAWIQGLFG